MVVVSPCISISHRVTQIDHKAQFEEACVIEIQLEKETNLSSAVFTVVQPSRNVQWKTFYL